MASSNTGPRRLVVRTPQRDVAQAPMQLAWPWTSPTRVNSGNASSYRARAASWSERHNAISPSLKLHRAAAESLDERATAPRPLQHARRAEARDAKELAQPDGGIDRRSGIGELQAGKDHDVEIRHLGGEAASGCLAAFPAHFSALVRRQRA